MLLFVCHANICRSALAERIAGQELGPDNVGSAGTHAYPGEPMHPGAAQVLRELGADATNFASRPVSADLITQADLVLTATREQRAFCVRMAPVALRRTFTIRQFGRLAAALTEPYPHEPDPDQLAGNGLARDESALAHNANGLARNESARPGSGLAATLPSGPATFGAPASAADLLDRIARVRGGLQPVPADEEDLADPVNGTRADMRACAQQIQLSLRPALALIRAG